MYSPIPYYQVTVRLPGAKKRTFWAEKVAPNQGDKTCRYYEVNREGEQRETEKDGVIYVHRHLWLVAPVDLLSEKPARMNLKYGELEVVKER